MEDLAIKYKTTEEINEAIRHDKRYGEEKAGAKIIDPIHWTKFQQIREISHGYIYMVKCLGDLTDKKLLDCGCGNGRFAVILAKLGAIVEAFDISSQAIEVGREYARLNHVSDRVHFSVQSFYELDYPSDYFDFIVGRDVLHHVQRKDALIEPLYRIVKPNGKIVFYEPLGNSKWLETLRVFVPVPVDGDYKTHWEEQIRVSDLDVFRDKFDVCYKEFHFFSRLDRVISSKKIWDWLGKIDLKLLNSFPFLRKYARNIVIEMIPKNLKAN